jgi:steroid delta-isomerase-like uncharacterized protein
VSEENKALVQALFDALDRQDRAAVNELVSDDFTAHVAGQPPDVDRTGWDGRVEMLYTGFPDLVHDYDQWFAEGDSVVLRATLRGTHLGEFMGHAGTGKTIRTEAVGIFKIANGKIVEEWAILDVAGLEQQIGFR